MFSEEMTIGSHRCTPAPAGTAADAPIALRHPRPGLVVLLAHGGVARLETAPEYGAVEYGFGTSAAVTKPPAA
jgi:hypothetical protein